MLVARQLAPTLSEIAWSAKVGDFDVKPLGANNYELHYDHIAQTGGAVTTYLNLDKRCKIITIDLEHTDANDTESTDTMDIRIDLGKNGRWRKIYSNATAAWEDATLFIDREFSPGEIRFITNTTNNHKLFITLTVEARQTGGYGVAAGGAGEVMLGVGAGIITPPLPALRQPPTPQTYYQPKTWTEPSAIDPGISAALRIYKPPVKPMTRPPGRGDVPT